MWKARPFKHSKTTSNVLVLQFITNEQVKLISFIWVNHFTVSSERDNLETVFGWSTILKNLKEIQENSEDYLFGQSRVEYLNLG